MSSFLRVPPYDPMIQSSHPEKLSDVVYEIDVDVCLNVDYVSIYAMYRLCQHGMISRRVSRYGFGRSRAMDTDHILKR